MSPLKSLLQRLRIESIYWIDDENASDAELDVDKLARLVATALVEANDGQRKIAIGELKKQSVKARSLGDTLHNRLSSGDEDVVDSVTELIVSRISDCVDEPKAVLVRMHDSLPRVLNAKEREGLVSIFSNGDGWTWTALSFAKWQEQHAAILEQHSVKERPALLIVDLQNTREASAISGSQIIEQWAQRLSTSHDSMAIYVVALTSSYKEDEEVIQGRRLTKNAFGEANAKPSLPVLVLSKGRLADRAGKLDIEERLVSAFSGALSRLRAFTLHEELAALLHKLFTDSTSEAFRVLKELSIEEMLLSVSTSSFIEGASEIDTLVRMASIAQRQSLLVGLVQQSALRQALIELRGLQVEQTARVSTKDLDSADGLGKLRCSEFHDPAQVVNSLLSAVTTGDIYEIVAADDSTEYCILVSNACDLMLRGITGQRKLEEGLLARLESGYSEDSDHSFRMVTFPPGSVLAGKQFTVNLLRMSVIPLTILDLCWSNDRGECVWTRDQNPSDTFALLPAQRLRYGLIDDELRALSNEKLSAYAPGIDRQVVYVDATSERQRIAFGVRRIGRLSSRFATELSAKLAHAIGRSVREHDFSAVT
jgi:hypothetical protein